MFPPGRPVKIKIKANPNPVRLFHKTPNPCSREGDPRPFKLPSKCHNFIATLIYDNSFTLPLAATSVNPDNRRRGSTVRSQYDGNKANILQLACGRLPDCGPHHAADAHPKRHSPDFAVDSALLDKQQIGARVDPLIAKAQCGGRQDIGEIGGNSAVELARAPKAHPQIWPKMVSEEIILHSCFRSR